MTGYLHLGYYAVEITLHRQIIRSLSSVDDLSLRSICRQAAQARLKSAMEFVQNLRPEHLQSFWYSASKYCFALVGTFISLLWVTALEVEEAESYKAKIHEYQWILRLSSKSADFMERALNMLATSTGILVKGIPERPDVKAILDRRRPLTYATGSIHSAHEENTSQPGIVNGHPAMGYHENAAPGPIASEAMLYEDGWDNDQIWFDNPNFSD